MNGEAERTSEERLEGSALLGHPIARAAMAVIRERGYGAADIDEITRRPGVDAVYLEHQFAGKADLTLRLLEAITDDYRARVGAAHEAIPTWPDNLRAAGWETARWILGNPEPVWFGMVGVLDAPEIVLARREELFRWCAGLVDAGRSLAPDPGRAPRAAAVMMVGSVVEGLRRQQEGTLPGGVVEAVPKMMYAAVRPYLGEEAARRELEIPPPPDLAGD
jgi:AcrR family transcriptional regulator